MSRARRLLDLLQHLRMRRRPTPAHALAAVLGVSVRTLYRDIDALRAQGATIDGGAGLGYVLRPGFVIPPLMFTAEEIEAVFLGASWVSRRKDLALDAAARSALTKIGAVVPAELAGALDEPGLIVGPAGDDRVPGIDVVAVRTALRQERKLLIGYADAHGRSSNRTVWPVALGIIRETQMLAAWCELRADFRHFRIDRISTLVILAGRLPRRRASLYKAWRERERHCLPPGLNEGGPG